MKILTVDDKSDERYMLESLLRGHGHLVDTAGNGVEALRLAADGHYDVIVSDILMPRMDGFQLCRELKRDVRLRRIPFVFYTAAYTDSQDAALGMTLGADRFITKPIEPELLLRQIEEAAAQGVVRAWAPVDETPEAAVVLLEEYNERLIAKLERKMIELEAANRALAADIAERQRVEAERERLQAQLYQAQKMEAIGALAGGIAHDFNNILTVIISLADLASLAPDTPGPTRGHLAGILTAAHRASQLTRQILAFSRQQEQQRVPMRLQRAVDEALKLLRPTIPSSIEIAAETDRTTPPVLADPTQVQQILANLLTNAWHAIGDHPGRIRLRLAPADVTADLARAHPELRPQPYARLSVTDTGHGMDRSALDRIFEPFFTTKETGRGTGLGLSVVLGIMRASDGAIVVESEVGRGTTFHLYFPAIQMEPESPATAPAIPAAGRGERVLLVDDEPALNSVAAMLLERLGYEVAAHTDPERALEQFRSEHFDLVITDMAMPRLTGADLGRRILDIRPTVPIILTSGFSPLLQPERARVLGFCEVLMKPYDLQALGESVARALRLGRSAPEP